ncbi:MAG TPA: hypothetical protein VF690_12515 [Hymenobacter sp.]|jgi:hypothetical protein
MKISLTEWIRTGLPSPLQWGATRHDFLRLWPGLHAELDAQAAGYPFLMLGAVEFYFQTDTFSDLCEVCIKAWALGEGEQCPYFDYGWLRRDLTNARVRAALQAQGVAYRVDPGPAFQTPNLRTNSGVLFAFDSDFEVEADAELMKVYLGLPMPGMWSWQ